MEMKLKYGGVFFVVVKRASSSHNYLIFSQILLDLEFKIRCPFTNWHPYIIHILQHLHTTKLERLTNFGDRNCP